MWRYCAATYSAGPVCAFHGAFLPRLPILNRVHALDGREQRLVLVTLDQARKDLLNGKVPRLARPPTTTVLEPVQFSTALAEHIGRWAGTCLDEKPPVTKGLASFNVRIFFPLHMYEDVRQALGTMIEHLMVPPPELATSALEEVSQLHKVRMQAKRSRSTCHSAGSGG